MLSYSRRSCGERNPAEGDIWERMVRYVKRILNITLKEDAPQDEPLTPNHFLLGTANTS